MTGGAVAGGTPGGGGGLASAGESDAMMYYEMTGFMPGQTTAPGEAPAAGAPAIDLPAPPDAWLLLDFDGSLVEIADRPDGVVVDPRVPALLKRAHERLDGRVALVSGRSIEALEAFLPDFPGDIVGTHGAEMRLAGEWRQTVDFDPIVVSRLQRLVADFATLRPEFLVEPKPSGVVLHYRQAEELGALALHFMETLAHATEGFKLQPALMAYELKPEGVGKDVGLRKLLAGDNRPAIYAGDDLTDEPAIEMVQDRGGVGIKIGTCDSVARHRLAGPAELIELLEEWLA